MLILVLGQGCVSVRVPPRLHDTRDHQPTRQRQAIHHRKTVLHRAH